MTTPAGRSQYSLDTDVLVEIGRRHNTTDPAALAARFYARQGLAPNPAALDIAELILRGEVAQ